METTTKFVKLSIDMEKAREFLKNTGMVNTPDSLSDDEVYQKITSFIKVAGLDAKEIRKLKVVNKKEKKFGFCDFDLDTLGNWFFDHKNNIIHVNCDLGDDSKQIDDFFGVDLMECGKMKDRYDFCYVLTLEYHLDTDEVKGDIDFCGVESEKFPCGFNTNFLFNKKEQTFLKEFLDKKCLEDTGYSLKDGFQKYTDYWYMAK